MARNDRRVSIDSYAQQSINLGGLDITFYRTVRVPEGRINSLPAGLGTFPVYKVKDFLGSVPKHWNEDSYFMPMYPQEAMWMGFGRNYNDPRAVIVAAGNINAITGKPFDPSKDPDSDTTRSRLEIKLEKEQNYIVTPPQPWLDGWKSEDGKVYQFVAAEMGSGETVEGQITGEETVGGIQLVVYKSQPGKIVRPQPRPNEHQQGYPYPWVQPWPPNTIPGPHPWGQPWNPWKWNDSQIWCSNENSSYSCLSRNPQTMRSMSAKCANVQDMGLGKGGEIDQKVYDDPYGLHVWNKKPEAAERIYLVSSYDFRQITGHNPPSTPVNYETYKRLGYPWFELWDKHMKDTPGSDVFDKLDSVSGGEKEHHSKTKYPEIFEKFEE